jgi:hypothetical protein
MPWMSKKKLAHPWQSANFRPTGQTASGGLNEALHARKAII